MPQVTLNGDVKQTLHQNLLLLLNEMGQTQGRFAVEINGELIPKSQSFISYDQKLVQRKNKKIG